MPPTPPPAWNMKSWFKYHLGRRLNPAYYKYKFNRYVSRREHLWATVPRYQLRMRVCPRNGVDRCIYLDGVWEEGLTDYLYRNLTFKEGDIVIDAGANIGWYSLVLDKMCAASGARVIAFEPGPSFPLLMQNIETNKAHSVTAVRKGLAEVSGHRNLYLGRDDALHSMLPLHSGTFDKGTAEVEVITLNEYWGKEGLEKYNPAFIKMDIEGSELMALRGASCVLERCPLVMVEYTPDLMMRFGMEPRHLVELMTSHNYVPHILAGDRLQKVDTDVDVLWELQQAFDKAHQAMYLFWSKEK